MTFKKNIYAHVMDDFLNTVSVCGMKDSCNGWLFNTVYTWMTFKMPYIFV